MTVHSISVSRTLAATRTRRGSELPSRTGWRGVVQRGNLDKCRRVETQAALQAKGREIGVRDLVLSPSARPLGEGSFGTVYQVCSSIADGPLSLLPSRSRRTRSLSPGIPPRRDRAR